MSEKNNGNARVELEDVINDVLTGSTLKNALDFAAFLRANEITCGESYGDIRYKDKGVCYMHIDGKAEVPGPWTIWTDGEYCEEREDMPMDEHMKEIARAHVNFCASCGGDCSPGKSATIFGKTFDNVCHSVMAFTDPDEEALACVKKLLEMKKREIAV